LVNKRYAKPRGWKSSGNCAKVAKAAEKLNVVAAVEWNDPNEDDLNAILTRRAMQILQLTCNRGLISASQSSQEQRLKEAVWVTEINR
jgi:hypothetical protein